MQAQTLKARLVVIASTLALTATALVAQTSAPVIGTVRIPAGVSANGQALPAGTYRLRLTNDAVSPVTGQGPDAARWVEFVQSGQVKGKELASVVAPADTKVVAKGAPPATGKSSVQLLKGADYVRVWINQAGTQYLVHLAHKAR